MFDALFSAFQAFNQIGFLFGGLICLGLAALIVFATIQTRQRSIKVQGRIVAVRCGGVVSGTRIPKEASPDMPSAEPKKIGMMEAAGRYYYPVYEYTSQNGETVRANSTSGSNSLNDKIHGTEVTLLVNPDEPWEANPPQILLFSFLVLIFMIPAGVFLYAAFANFKFNIFTVVFALAFVAYGGFKFAKTIKPRDQWETPSGFKLRRREERREKAENTGGYILTPEEFNERLNALNRYSMILTPFMFLIALGLLAGGFYLERDMADFSAHAQKVRGEVVGLNSHSSGDGSSYYAVVEFRTPEGKKTNFEDNFGSNPPMYTVGDKVDVMYDPTRPSHARIDHGLFNNLPALACYGFGGLLLWGSVTCWRNARRRREG